MHVAYDADTKTLGLSAILEWYGQDFEPGGGYLKFLLERVTDDTVKTGIQLAVDGDVKVVFNSYDWALNTRGERAADGPGTKTDFGSGSIPNE